VVLFFFFVVGMTYYTGILLTDFGRSSGKRAKSRGEKTDVVCRGRKGKPIMGKSKMRRGGPPEEKGVFFGDKLINEKCKAASQGGSPGGKKKKKSLG